MLTPKELTVWVRFLRAVRSLKLEDGVAAISAGAAGAGWELLVGSGWWAYGVSIGAGVIGRCVTQASTKAINRRRLRATRARCRPKAIERADPKSLPEGQGSLTEDGQPER